MNIGSYELIGRVASAGRGGSVWKAHDHALDRTVALKQVPSTETILAGRLRAEARMLAGLSHPSIVSVFELIQTPGQLWLVEEWVEGGSLEDMMASTGRLSAAQALGLTRDALMGLAYVHSRGVVHGDVSPSNIMVDLHDRSKLVDFGLAAVAGAVGVAGTPGYLSPQAARGEPIYPWDDIYSAGAVLAFLLRGEPIFSGPTAEAVLAAQLAMPTPRLDGMRPAVASVLQRALARESDQRYAAAREFVLELEAAANHDYSVGWEAGAGLTGAAAGAVASVVSVNALGSVLADVLGNATIPGAPPAAPSATQHAAVTQHPGPRAHQTQHPLTPARRARQARTRVRRTVKIGSHHLGVAPMVGSAVGAIVLAAVGVGVVDHLAHHRTLASPPSPARGSTTTGSAGPITIGTPITAGIGPGRVVVTPNGKTAYVLDTEVQANENVGVSSASVYPVNLTTGKVGAAIRVPPDPSDITISPDGRTVYVVSATASVGSQHGAVTPIDVTTNTPEAPISISGIPRAIAIAPSGDTAYVANGTDLTAISLATSRVVRSIPVSGGNVLINPQGTMAYVDSQYDSGGSNGYIAPVDLGSGKAGKPIVISAPSSLAMSADGSIDYVLTDKFTSNGMVPYSVVPINVITGQVSAALPIGISFNAADINEAAVAVDPTRQLAYVAYGEFARGSYAVLADGFFTVNLRTGAKGKQLALPRASEQVDFADEPNWQMALSPDGAHAYLCDGTQVIPIQLN